MSHELNEIHIWVTKLEDVYQSWNRRIICMSHELNEIYIWITKSVRYICELRTQWGIYIQSRTRWDRHTSRKFNEIYLWDTNSMRHIYESRNRRIIYMSHKIEGEPKDMYMKWQTQWKVHIWWNHELSEIYTWVTKSEESSRICT